MKVLGIDPGASGAFCLLDTETNHLEIHDMPTVEVKVGRKNARRVSAPMVASIVDWLEADAAFIEAVHAMPGQGVSSMFAFGRALGVLEGVVAKAGIPVTMVPPAEWTKAMRLKGGKDGSRARACELWPKQAHLFARVKDDGRAEAALIAAYGANHLG